MPPISCTECKQHPLVTRITGSNAETGSALRVALVDEDGSFNCSLGQKVVWGRMGGLGEGEGGEEGGFRCKLCGCHWRQVRRHTNVSTPFHWGAHGFFAWTPLGFFAAGGDPTHTPSGR